MRYFLHPHNAVTSRAYAAVLAARLYRQRTLVLYCCVAALVIGTAFPQRNAAAVLFCTLVGIVMAQEQRPGRYLHLDRCEQSAPLFGRELGRAKALVPCLATVIVALPYAFAAFWSGADNAPLDISIALCAAVPATLIALCATVRHGVLRALYIALGCAAAAAAYVLAIVAHSFVAEIAFSTIASFLALRQYGEALARFDPI